MNPRIDAVCDAIRGATESASQVGLHGPELQAHAFVAAFDVLMGMQAAQDTPPPPVVDEPAPVVVDEPQPEAVPAADAEDHPGNPNVEDEQ